MFTGFVSQENAITFTVRMHSAYKGNETGYMSYPFIYYHPCMPSNRFCVYLHCAYTARVILWSVCMPVNPHITIPEHRY